MPPECSEMYSWSIWLQATPWRFSQALQNFSMHNLSNCHFSFRPSNSWMLSDLVQQFYSIGLSITFTQRVVLQFFYCVIILLDIRTVETWKIEQVELTISKWKPYIWFSRLARVFVQSIRSFDEHGTPKHKRATNMSVEKTRIMKQPRSNPFNKNVPNVRWKSEYAQNDME